MPEYNRDQNQNSQKVVYLEVFVYTQIPIPIISKQNLSPVFAMWSWYDMQLGPV